MDYHIIITICIILLIYYKSFQFFSHSYPSTSILHFFSKQSSNCSYNPQMMNQDNSKDAERYIQAGIAAICLLMTMIISLLLLIIFWAANNIYRRQIRLRVLVSYLNYTMMKQNFPSSIFERMLAKINYDHEKLEKERHEFMKWCVDPKGVSYRQPDDMFTPAAADDPQYATIRDMEQKDFWKAVGSGGTLSGQGQASAKQPTIPSKIIIVPESIRTSFTQPDDGLYEDPTKESSGTKKTSTSSVKTSYTQDDDDGLYENPTGADSKSRKSGKANATDSTRRSKIGGGSRIKTNRSKSKKTAVSGWKSGRAKSNSTESSGESESGRPSARTAYNTEDGDYENIGNLKFN